MYLMQWGRGSREGASPGGLRGEEPTSSQLEVEAQREAGPQLGRQRPKGVRVPPPAPTAGGSGCDEVPPRRISSYPDKEQQAFKLPLSAFEAKEGNVFVRGDLPEGFFFVISEVNLDPPPSVDPIFDLQNFIGSTDTIVLI
jgi:hypothetical protein